ncbi:MAG: hypothetical protein IAB80_00320 [Bacteroidetes bacterium]|uniref:Uncharacterized protein n=1 Tax=Candidatus Cryptobacteroides excrementipullorum TaxID=2840761 RepID=A0A9D9IRJ0_9BACT|nr:hypothetical protein [Candidatus Cryptobacteroides excrementipullorum]
MGDLQPKALVGLNKSNYDYPLADVSHLSDEEKNALRIRGIRARNELNSDEEFEQWVAVFAPRNVLEGAILTDGTVLKPDPDSEETQEDIMSCAAYERSLWYHRKRFRAWKEKHLQPLVDDLADEARNAPQYDWQYLYGLEYKKLICMRAYFSHSLIADEDGNYGFNRWIDTCISLLKHIKDEGMHISEAQIEKMNVRNLGDIVTHGELVNFLQAPAKQEDDDIYPDKIYYGTRLYVRKMERLYYRIRLYKMREWWE